jgi:GDP/UDP-N,N'-diacetylbacillosamine 2-epimerase (hydrolysing)
MNVAVATSNRADYYLLNRVIYALFDEQGLDLFLYVCGAHPYEDYGSTYKTVLESFPDAYVSRDLVKDDHGNVDLNSSIIKTINNFSLFIENNKIEWLIVLGDRYEIFGCVVAAFHKGVRIAHLYGGETTHGSNDQKYRDSISIFGELHFVSNEFHKQRLLKIGIENRNIYVIGYLGLENIKYLKSISDNHFLEKYGIDLNSKIVLMLFHPEKESLMRVSAQKGFIKKLIQAYKDCNFIITSANNDKLGNSLNHFFKKLSEMMTNVIYVENFGSTELFNLSKKSLFVIGNSSSLVMEIPSLGVYTVLVGERQKGRITHESVISVDYILEDIIGVIDRIIMGKYFAIKPSLTIDRLPSKLFLTYFKSSIGFKE